MLWSATILRFLGVRKWKPSPHYAECRRQAEKRLGDLSLLGERVWPDRDAPFDEYDPEGRLHGLDRQEHIEMRRWAGRARA